MNPIFMELLQNIRNEYKKIMVISSGYRDKSHPIEAKKDKPGEHTYGMGADIICSGSNALALVCIAIEKGIQRIGINQKGAYIDRFIHLGIADRLPGNDFPVAIWSY